MNREIKLPTYKMLDINQKIHIKQVAMNVHSNRVHYLKPNHLENISETGIIYLLSCESYRTNHYNKK